jgi:hypothetical protein
VPGCKYQRKKEKGWARKNSKKNGKKEHKKSWIKN